MATQSTRTEIEAPESDWESDSSSLSSRHCYDKNDSIDQETTTTDTIDNDLGDQQQHTSSISEEQFSSGSCSPTLPGSPLSATPMWEFTAPASIRCEQSVAGNALHFTFSTNPVGSQPTKAVPDWTQPIREALTESRPIAPFRQMYKPLSDEDMRCVRKRLEGYTDKARKQSKLDEFECAVILEDARTLFSEAVLLKSIIATPTQRTEASPRKRNIPPTEAIDREERIKRQRRR